MPVNFLTALLTSFIGTLGFAVLLHTPQRAWIARQLASARWGIPCTGR